MQAYQTYINPFIYLNNKMLSFVIKAGYEGCDIAEKIHNPRP